MSGVTPISRATCCPEGRPIFLPRLEVPLRQQAESVGVGQRRLGQLEQRIGQRSVELAHWPGCRASAPATLKNLLH